MERLAVIVLAAGLGKRMGANLPKVSVSTDESPLITHVLGTVAQLEPDELVVVTGHKREMVEEIVQNGVSRELRSRLRFAQQREQLGTGHAARCGLDALGDFRGLIMILYGDAPLVRPSTLESLRSIHESKKGTLSLVSLLTHLPNDYGRIIRDPSRRFVEKIVEAKDCGPDELLVREFNAGIYLTEAAFLRPALSDLKNDNAQSEYYLTDIVGKAASEGQTVVAFPTTDFEEVQGVNDLKDLALVNTALNRRRVERLILAGVLVKDPASLWVDPHVKVSPGAQLGPMIQLRGNTVIETGVRIEGTAYLKDTVVRQGAELRLGVRSESSEIGERASVGPFAHLREGSILGEEARIGNFVETKKTVLGKGAKASHLTYLGDCSVGEHANIGAGTITCNYDGYKKSKTVIGSNAFIGSNSSLVAPVVVEDGATVGAGSVITKKVERDSLALTRAEQVSKPGWSARRRASAVTEKSKR